MKAPGRQQAFSLLELLLVLGVVVLLALVAFVVLTKVERDNDASLETSRLTVIAANIKRVFGGTSQGYEAVATDVANKARVFPKTMNADSYVDNAPIANAWDGAVTVGPEPEFGRFFVRYEAVPQDDCSGLVAQSVSRFEAVRVNGVAVRDSAGPSNLVELDVSALTQACATEDLAVIEWVGN